MFPNNLNTLSPLEAALAYAEQGLKVFPCREKDDGDYKIKAPYIAGGFKSASDDPDQIRLWWAKFPNALIGLVTGREAGLVVIDIDVAKGKRGLETLKALGGDVMTSWLVRTPSGGGHQYFKYPPGENIASGQNVIGEHVDHRGDLGYVIAPGSVTPDGRYEFVEGREPWAVDLEPLPAVYFDLLVNKAPQAQHSKSHKLPNELEKPASRHLKKISYDEAVEKIVPPLKLRYVRDHWEGAPCPSCGGGTKDRLTLKPDDHGDAWLICNAGCKQSDIWKALIEKGVVSHQELGQLGYKWIQFPDTKKSGAPKGTLDNYRHLLAEYEVIARYDVISKTEEIIFPGIRSTDDNRLPSALAEIASLTAQYGLPSGRMEQMVFKICDENPFNPILEWIKSSPWDGQQKISELINTVDSDEPRLTPILIRKWLISLVCALISQRGYAVQGVLVLQGDQGIGKSRWLAALCPEPINKYFLGGHVLDPRNKDSVLATTRHWIAELGELDGTFRRADVAVLKAFLTSDKDVIRKPYGRVEIERPRRTGFAATVNDVGFLQDDTGNRRYYTVRCENLDADHGIDMQQLWAEVLHLVESGAQAYLTEAEAVQLERSNQISMSISPIEELIRERFKWGEQPSRYMSATQICEEIGFQNPTQFQVRQAAAAVRNIKGIQTFDKRRTKTFHMPICGR